MCAVGVAAKSELSRRSLKIRSKPPYVEVTSVDPFKPNFALWLDFVDTSLRPSESIDDIKYTEQDSPPGGGNSFPFETVDVALVCLAPR